MPGAIQFTPEPNCGAPLRGIGRNTYFASGVHGGVAGTSSVAPNATLSRGRCRHDGVARPYRLMVTISADRREALLRREVREQSRRHRRTAAEMPAQPRVATHLTAARRLAPAPSARELVTSPITNSLEYEGNDGRRRQHRDLCPRMRRRIVGDRSRKPGIGDKDRERWSQWR